MKNKISITGLLEPLSEYLISIETVFMSENETHYSYKLGVPKNWVMNTNMVDVEFVGETSDLQLLKLLPVDYKITKDEFFDYLVTLINKNKIVDQKRMELENKIKELKSKFADEQDSLMKELYKELDEQQEDDIVEQEENGGEQ